MVFSASFNFMKKLFLPLFFIAMFVIFTPQKSHAKNWMMIQGTEQKARKKGKKGAFLRVWGFVQPQFTYQSNGRYAPFKGNVNGGAGNVNVGRGHSSFLIRRARLGARGALNDRISYFFLTEFGDNGFTRRNGASNPARTQSVAVLTDATVTVRILGEMLYLRMGQLKLPFGIDGFQGIPAWTFASESEVTAQMLLRPNRNWAADTGIGAARLIGAYRDIGAMLFGEVKVGPGKIGYGVGLFNGNNVNQQDDNQNKDVIGKAQYDIKIGKFSAEIGGSFAFGKHTELLLNYMRLGGELEVIYGPFGLRGEYIVGADEQTAARQISTGAKEINDRGFYAMGWYYIVPKTLHFLVRYDQFVADNEAGQSEDYVNRLTFGLNFHFLKQNKFIFNYEKVLRDTFTKSGGVAYRDGDDIFHAQFIFIFG